MAITSAFQADDAGSIPAARSRCADMAQLVERTLGKGEVPSSTLGISTISFISSLILSVNLALRQSLVDVTISLIYPCLRGTSDGERAIST